MIFKTHTGLLFESDLDWVKNWANSSLSRDKESIFEKGHDYFGPTRITSDEKLKYLHFIVLKEKFEITNESGTPKSYFIQASGTGVYPFYEDAVRVYNEMARNEKELVCIHAHNTYITEVTCDFPDGVREFLNDWRFGHDVPHHPQSIASLDELCEKWVLLKYVSMGTSRNKGRFRLEVQGFESSDRDIRFHVFAFDSKKQAVGWVERNRNKCAGASFFAVKLDMDNLFMLRLEQTFDIVEYKGE